MVSMPHWPHPNTNIIQRGTCRVQAFLDLLGSPEENLPPVIHISGTNGKGSVLAYLKAILEDAGYTTHRYISPHLIRFNERIELLGDEISDDALFLLAEQCRVIAEQNPNLQYSFFEGITAMAFLAFSQVKADALLLETGMGGELDATNVIENPAISIITTVSHDHTEFLGTTLAEIAHEKAGIIKPNCPCVISWQPEEVLDVLRDCCLSVGAQCFAYGKDWNLEVHNEGNSNTLYVYVHKERFGPYKVGLRGIHQFLNAATAIVSAYILRSNLYQQITHENIKNGVLKAKWPARMELLTSGVLNAMMPNEWELILDGAHNIGGAEMVAASIRGMDKKPLYLIYGRTIQKDPTKLGAFLEYFRDIAKMICCVTVKYEPRGEKGAVIHEVIEKLGFRSIVCESLKDAILACVADSDISARILICGSLYLAGDVSEANAEAR